MKILLAILFIILCGCSIVTYKGNPDGSTTITAYELGSKTALAGARFTTDSKGVRSLEIDSLSQDQVQGMQEVNQGISMILEGLAKGTVKGIKP